MWLIHAARSSTNLELSFRSCSRKKEKRKVEYKDKSEQEGSTVSGTLRNTFRGHTWIKDVLSSFHLFRSHPELASKDGMGANLRLGCRPRRPTCITATAARRHPSPDAGRPRRKHNVTPPHKRYVSVYVPLSYSIREPTFSWGNSRRTSFARLFLIFRGLRFGATTAERAACDYIFEKRTPPPLPASFDVAHLIQVGEWADVVVTIFHTAQLVFLFFFCWLYLVLMQRT